MKKSIKQLLSVVLVIAMMASLLVVPAAAADPQPGDVGYKWDFSNFKDTTTYPVSGETTYNGLTLKNVGAHDNGYANFNSNGTIEVPVNGPCQVAVQCQYGAGGTVGVGNDTVNLVRSDDGTDVALYSYKGTGSGTVTITRTDGNVYVRYIELLAAQADDEYTITAPATAVVKEGESVEVAVSANKSGTVYATTKDTALITLGDITDGKLSITGEKAGEATVTLGVEEGKGTKEIKVTVYAPVTGPVTKWDFSAVDFSGVITTSDTEYNGLKLDGVKSHNGKYAYFNQNATLDIPVDGPCAVIVNCEYGNHGTVGVGEDVIDLVGDNDKNIDTTVYYYTGEAGYVTVARGNGDLYLTGIELATSVWDFSAADFSGKITTSDTEYNGLKLKNVKSHNEKYAHFDSNATMDIPVPGPCNVTVNCEYGNGGTVGVGEDVIDLEGDNDSGIDTTVYHYAGPDAGTVTVAYKSGNLYLTSVSLGAYTDPSAQLELSAQTALLELGGQAVEITAQVVNGTADGEMTAVVAEGGADMVTAAVAEGKVTLTPGTVAGKTTVTVSVPAQNSKGEANTATADIAVTVVDPNVTPTEWVWGGKDGSHSTATFEADSVGLKFAEGNKVTAEDGSVTYAAVGYHNHYGLLAKPKMAEDGETIEVPATIGIPVEGPSKITVEVGYTWDIMLGDAQVPDRYGTSDNGDSTSEYQFPVVFDYYGGAGYVTLTATEKTSTYIYSIKVERDETIPAVPKVAVWDLAGTQLDETMYDNKLTVEDIIAFYPPSEQWPDPKVPTLTDFATKDGEFEFVAEANDNEALSHNGRRSDYRLRSGVAALKDWVHSTNNHTKNDVALGADPYDPTLTQYNVSFQSNGGAMTFKIKANAGDKLTFTYANSGTADGAIFMDFIDAADAGTEGKVTKVLENQKGVGNGNIGSVYVAADGIQTLTHGLDPDGNVQKPAVSRFYRETPIKATISGNLAVGAGVPAGYKLIATDDVSGVEYVGTVKDGKYSIEVNNYLSGTSFTLSVADAEGCIVGSGEAVEIPAAATSAENDVAIIQVSLVTISGAVTGLEAADLANLVIDVAIPEGKIYVPKIVPAEDGTYTASLEKGVEYTLTAKNVNDYTQGFSTLNKTADETGVDLAFTAKPCYMVTLIAIPTDVDMSEAKFTFTNVDETDELHPDGYAYTFTGADIIELRDGQYKVKMDNAPYPAKVISDLKVAGAATSKTITFVKETPTSWVFTKDAFTKDVLDAKDFNMLKLDGDVRREEKDHGILGNGGKMSVPVDGPCKVNVTVYYAAEGTVGVGEDTVPLATDVSTGTTGATDTITYEYTGSGAGYVDVIGTATSYITRIDVVTATPYAATLTVGADKEFETIQAAVDAASRMERPNNERVTIMIDPGNYEEMVWVQTPNITLKNAAANPSIALKNKGVDIDDNAVRITWYYGCGFDYYSMGVNSKFSADQLAVNLENGYLSHPNSAGGGSNNECWWNATTVIAATGFQAEDIIFENSFNQYVSAAAGRDKIVPNGGAKEDRSKPRADLPVGSTEVQRKVYVERAAAIALANDKADNAFFDHCAFVGHQDVIYGGRAVRAGFYDCDVFGACDYVFGPMTAVFAKCDMVLNVGADSDSNDAAYITAPQNGSDAHGYLMYNCNVRNVEPGVESAGTAKSALQHEWGRAWGGATAECVFFETTVGTNANDKSLISPAGWNTGLGSSQICAEYHTHDEATDADYTQRIMGGVLENAETKAGASLMDWAGWMKGWDPFVGKSMIIEGCPDKDVDASELAAALVAANKAVSAYPAMADATDAADVAKGEKFVTESAKAALETAITEASKVASKPAPTQDEIAAAVPALKQAVANFQAAVQTGTKAVDMTALDAAIAAAKTTAGAYAAKPDATVASDVEMGEQYVTEADKAALDKAVADAEAAKAKTDATQAEVNAAVWALNKAVNAFKAAVQTGTKLADRTALLAALDAANKATTGVVVMDDGTKPEDVAKDVKFVTKSDKDALDAAIAAAKAVVAKGNASQAEVDAAVAPLTQAVADFQATIQTGTNDTGVADKDALAAAIVAAEGVYAIGNDVKVLPAGTKTSTVDKGQKFVTQDVYDALAAAIDAAKAVLADPSATEEDIAKAVADLNAAKDAFKVQTGTKGTGGGSSGGSVGTTGTTTTTKTNANGDTVKKTTDRDGNVTYTVTSKDGELLATVKLPATVSALAKKFKDVPDDHWAASSINDLAALGMVKGVADEIYDMPSPVTRGSLATILFRLAQGKAGLTSDFSDVTADTWYADAVGWAAKTGVVNGFEDGSFRPDASITREQLVVMLYRFAKLLALDTSAEGSLASFTDGSNTSDWAKEAMVWAVGAGIVKGDNVKALHPTTAATRAETACMVDRFLGLMK